MHVQILWQGQKAVPTIVEIEIFDIFYSKFQLASAFFNLQSILCWKLASFAVTWSTNE